MRQYIFSAVATVPKGNSLHDVVHTVGIVTGYNVLEAESKALLFAEKRWPLILGWRQHSVTVLEVEPTQKRVREDEETMSITFQVNEQ